MNACYQANICGWPNGRSIDCDQCALQKWESAHLKWRKHKAGPQYACRRTGCCKAAATAEQALDGIGHESVNYKDNSRKHKAPLAQLHTQNDSHTGIDIAAMKLMSAIKRTKDVAELADVWQKQSTAFNSMHVSAATLHLARLVTQPNIRQHSRHGHSRKNTAADCIPKEWKPLFSSMLVMAKQHLSKMDSCGLANTVSAMGLLQHQDVALLTAIVDAVADEMPLFSLPQLTALIRGLAQLKYRPGRAWRLYFYQTTIQKVIFSKLDTKQLPGSCTAGCFWAVSQLDLKPPPGWISTLLSHTHLASCKPSELSGLIHALARLQFSPPASWLKEFLNIALQQLEEQLQSQQNPKPHSVVDQQGMTAHTAAQGSSRTSDNYWHLSELLQLVWACAQLRVEASHQLWPNCFRMISAEMQHAQPRELVMLLQAVSMMYAHPQPPSAASNGNALPQPLLLSKSALPTEQSGLVQQILNQVANRLHQFETREVVLILTYCARLRVRPKDAILVVAIQHLQPRLMSANMQDLSQLAFCLGRFNVKHWGNAPIVHHKRRFSASHWGCMQAMLQYQRFTKCFLECTASKLRTATPDQLANLCWGLGMMGVKPSLGWLLVLCESIEACIGQCKAGEINQLSWAMPRLATRVRWSELLSNHRAFITTVQLLYGACQQPLLVQRLGDLLRTKLDSFQDVRARCKPVRVLLRQSGLAVAQPRALRRRGSRHKARRSKDKGNDQQAGISEGSMVMGSQIVVAEA